MVNAYDVDSGSYLGNYEGTIENVSIGLANDPTTGAVYGITYNSEGDGVQLARVDYTLSGVTTTPISSLEGNWNTLACSPEGQLYGIRYDAVGTSSSYTVTGSELCRIDKASGQVTVVGPTGMAPQFVSSGAIDPRSGRMFWNVCPPDNSGLLCEVNLATGAATVLGQLADNDEICGMFVAEPLAEDGAPAAVTGLSATFAGTSLSGTVEFTAPATLYDGTAASGAVDYTVKANGAVVAQGATSFGARVSAPVTVPASGDYTFAVTASNAAGASPETKLSLYVGHAAPASPAPVLAARDGRFELSWNSVGDGIVYNVERYPGAVAVATRTASTQFSEAIPATEAMTEYYYAVTACNGDALSRPGLSNSIAIGSIVPPYENDFDGPNPLSGFTIIDANNDGDTWLANEGTVQVWYNSTNDMDDWLITPALALEGGKSYHFSVKARNNGYGMDERIEVKWGAAPTVAGMTETLVGPTLLTGNKTFHELEGMIAPQTDGTYYVGLHGISDAFLFVLVVDDLKIGAPATSGAPGPSTDLTLEPDPLGALKVKVSFKAPAVDLGGQPLQTIDRIDLSRNGEVVKVFENPAVGEALEYIDEVGQMMQCAYSVQAFNVHGQGEVAAATVNVGVYAPAAPENVRAEETATPGEVKVSWDAVTTNRYEDPINPDYVWYTVMRYDNASDTWTPVNDEPVRGTSYVFTAVEPGSQKFMQFAVMGTTSGGDGYATSSDMIAVGTPYPGLAESFAGASLHYAWATTSYGNGEWGIYGDSSISGVTSSDNDGGFAAMKATYPGDYGMLYSGKVSLAGLSHPGVSVHTYLGTEGNLNQLVLYAKEPAQENWQVLRRISFGDLAGQTGWVKISAPLEGFVGKTVQIGIMGEAQTDLYTFADNIQVGELTANDIAVSGIHAPSLVYAGNEYTVSAQVTNEGTAAATAFTVELLADGEVAETATVQGLQPGESRTVEFKRSFGMIDAKAVEYTAVARYDADEVPQNNTSRTVTVTPRHTTLPAASGLTAALQADGVRLQWNEPDFDGYNPQTLTDFEDGTPWAPEYAGWTFIDLDQGPVGTFQSINVPGLTPGVSRASFIVFDASGSDFNSTFDAFSGSKYLAAFFRTDGKATDDWAVSPRLSGFAQTVSFRAKSYGAEYPESIEILYSTGSLDPDYFMTAKPAQTVPNAWTEYTVDLPQGARYFAVRSSATGNFMLMLDDFRFMEEGATATPSLIGYDVYRNGSRVTDTPTAETEYLDTLPQGDSAEYAVVAVYTSGASAPSDKVTVTLSGIDGTAGRVIGIAGGRGAVTVSGAEGLTVEVVAVDGRVVFNGTAAAESTVPVAPGVYVVRVADTTAKIAVR